MLVLHNVRMVQTHVRKKKKEPPNVTKLQSDVMLVLHNVRMIQSNVRKKIREQPNVTSTVICDIGIAQCEDGIIKCQEKKKGNVECDKSAV